MHQMCTTNSIATALLVVIDRGYRFVVAGWVAEAAEAAAFSVRWRPVATAMPSSRIVVHGSQNESKHTKQRRLRVRHTSPCVQSV